MQQTGRKLSQEISWLGGESDPQRLKFDDSEIWYMLIQESISENEMYKILCNFDIQADQLIQSERAKGLEKRLTELKKNRDNLDHSTVKIS